ncbi:hypothetical protein CEXT_468781 [Caerostris extrusa]|uniref:Uncharacterized protein n=1 Tax=Caerostris extrusa TaxID=172846 RepID=A0AAV4P6Q3_CAEEX|nr:hypothetical protein CEXT_468781 [Caerostris extrusa]
MVEFTMTSSRERKKDGLFQIFLFLSAKGCSSAENKKLHTCVGGDGDLWGRYTRISSCGWVLNPYCRPEDISGIEGKGNE